MITKKRVRLVSRIVFAPFAYGFIVTVRELDADFNGRPNVFRTMGSLLIAMFTFVFSLIYIPGYLFVPKENYPFLMQLFGTLIASQVAFTSIWWFLLLILKTVHLARVWWEDVPEDVVRVEKTKKRKHVSTEYNAMSDNPDAPVEILDEETFQSEPKRVLTGKIMKL